MAQRVITLVCLAASLGVVVGGGAGYALKTHITANDKGKEVTGTNTQSNTKTILYGVYDDFCKKEEVPLDWSAGDLDFKPLDCRMPEEQQEFVFFLCKGYNVDFTLVMALIQQESSFNPNVVSPTNDYGYMQINAINHEWLTKTIGVTDYLDPYQNIRAGVFVLRKLIERYQDTNMVLMAYNMGETGASRLWEKGIFSTDYTQDILTIQEQFNDQLEGDEVGKEVESC